MERSEPSVLIAVPALNEARYIGACLESLAGQWPEGLCEIVVADGGSTDGTPAVVAQFAAAHPGVRCIANPGRLQAAGVNLVARMGGAAPVLVRADAHAVYPPGWLRACVAALLREGATSVVVPMRNAARPGAGMQRAVAAAQSSRLGNGGSRHRAGGVSGWVEHGHHAVFDRAFFLARGGYDAGFSHNEDAELDVRQAQAGGRIWMCAEAPVTYFPRAGLAALARQYARHGAGRARTLLKHGLRPRPRQMAPVALVLGLVVAALAAPWWVLAYPGLCLVWGAGMAVWRRDPWLLGAGPALMAMHLGWGVGFLAGVVRYWPWGRRVGGAPVLAP